jgi:uncharacterized protein involved in exopolysaccharide biosynthesis
MQAQDSQSITRRPLDVEDYIDIIRRHKSWIFGPTFAALVAATVIAFLWPDTFVSQGTIRVVPPQVPEAYVPSNLNSDLQGRLNSMIQGILNKDTLTEIINQHDLYKKERSRLPLDDVVESMRQHDIHIGAVQSFAQVNGNKQAVAAFQVGFSYYQRYTAQKVAQDLINRILLENQSETTKETMQTTEFLKGSWEAAKKKLDDVENKLTTFRGNNVGRLPEQQAALFQQLNALQTQMLSVNASMSRVNQDKLLLENQMRIYKEQLSSLKDPVPQAQNVQQKNDKLAEKDHEIAYYENALSAARERYKESHPDVQALESKLATAKKQRDDIAKQEDAKKPEVATDKPQPSPQYVQQQRDLDTAIKRLQGMVEAKDLEMQDYQKQVVQINTNIKTVQQHLEGAPVGLKEYEELMRDRDLARKDYETLDNKVRSSDMATRVINNQQGERLEQLESAGLPQTPTEPKRPVIVLAGAGLGLILGLFLAGAREVKDSSLKNLKDVRAYTQLPILGSIPLLENDLVVRRRRRLTWLAWTTACFVGLIVMSSSVIYYYATKL